MIALQLRRWVHDASFAERSKNAGVAIIIVALVTLALLPAPGERADDALDTTGQLQQGDGSLPLAREVLGDVGSNGTGDGTGGGTTATGSTVPSRVSPRGGSPTTLPGTPGTDPVRPGVPGATPLRATDRGVSAESIKVGFAVASWKGADEAGLVTDMRNDVSEAVDAFVKYANKRGGVLGRRIDPVKVRPDLTSSDDQRKKCVELTETEGVFSVIDSFAFSFETGTACITAEHKTLLLNGNPGSSRNVRLGSPYSVSLYKDDNRKMKDLVTAASATGFFDRRRGFEKLGILAEECASSMVDAPTDGLKAHLRAAGVTEWSEFRAGCTDATPRGGAEAALQFMQAHVTHVLLLAHPPHVKWYLEAAGRSRYRPKYFAGDYFNLILGGLVEDYEPDGFDGALAVTQTHAGEGAIGKPLSPLAKTCSDILVDHGLPPVSSAAPDDIGDDLEILELCESFFLFLQVAAAAGPELTRATWIEALASTGDFRGASTDLSRFDRRGKITGGDTMKLVQWHASCMCWKQHTEFEPAAG